MTGTEDKCIYCSRSIDSQRGEGDHVLPAALGRFRNEFRFRRICPGCNNRLGTVEETLLRSAPEALFRKIVRPAVKRKKRGDSWVAAKGGAKPKAMRKHPDHAELVELSPDDPHNVTPKGDQLAIVDPERGEQHILLFPSMTAKHLRRKLDELGIEPPTPMFLHADAANWEHHVNIIKEVLPGATVVETGTDEPGQKRVPGRIEFRFSDDYWRAIAKIAFHYYLVTTQRGFKGDEPEFEAIRTFIMEGGDLAPFFENVGATFRTPFRKLPGGGAMLSAVWAHLLAADEEQRRAVAIVSLFVGPERLPPLHHVLLGRFRSPLVVPHAQRAHAYIYCDAGTDNQGFAGRVVAKSVTKLR